MHPALYSHRNPNTERPSVDCSCDIDTARQEFKDDTDINVIWARFGSVALMGLPRPTYGEVDFDMDLQQAYTSVQTAQDAYDRLSPELRAKYGSWNAILSALLERRLTVEELSAGTLTGQPASPEVELNPAPAGTTPEAT